MTGFNCVMRIYFGKDIPNTTQTMTATHVTVIDVWLGEQKE